MKKLVLITLLLAFMAKPLYNLSYLVYYQVNIDYIIENYCVNKTKVEMACNGKCHLAKQLQQNDATDEQNNAVKLFSELFSVVFYQSKTLYSFSCLIFYRKGKINSFYSKNYRYAYSASFFKPPIA
ncbi:hypothetical protein LG651_14515 [Tamlana sp. 62-3]|uniref:Uncharacterized protein n=1 Tax=Neotamlana sargassicola TaxID=2883125 RepID=A0A9X1L832_9FLAO|nr:hypothetical protein [Tamlana sargassicola]MCB4809466.1 hypothetical protein [Tamlana sargassicola]